MNLRNDLFGGWAGCSNGDCVVRDNSKGMHTNGTCKCVVGASRAQLSMLQSRINRLIQQPAPLVRLTDKEIDELFKAHIGKHVTEFSKAIMDAMIKKNGGKQ